MALPRLLLLGLATPLGEAAGLSTMMLLSFLPVSTDSVPAGQDQTRGEHVSQPAYHRLSLKGGSSPVSHVAVRTCRADACA